MMRAHFLLLFIFFVSCNAEVQKQETIFNPLTEEEQRILFFEGTEPAFSGMYDKHFEKGTYHCKLCNRALFDAKSKFNSRTGWPSFDAFIGTGVETKKDGNRTEIHCAHCQGHLGHVFYDEGFTPNNTRHCVNSLSLQFYPDTGLQRAYFAGGCFWGVEYYLEMKRGVKSVTSGFMGGTVANPSYKEVVEGETGHVEVVEVLYDSSMISYKTLAKLFFEIHDPTQTNGQGPDIGEQYVSQIFVSNMVELKIIEGLIRQLEKKGLKIATEIRDIAPFYSAEAYHQDYYIRKGTVPYCHGYEKRF